MAMPGRCLILALPRISALHTTQCLLAMVMARMSAGYQVKENCSALLHFFLQIVLLMIGCNLFVLIVLIKIKRKNDFRWKVFGTNSEDSNQHFF